MKYNPPYQVEPDQKTYYTTLKELHPTFHDFTAKKSKLIADANPPRYIDNERRALIVQYFVDSRRAFNYSKEPRRFRPYEIAKDAYDINYFNYGFQMKEV